MSTKNNPDTGNPGGAGSIEAGDLSRDFSTETRARAQSLEAIPAELRALDHWVLYDLVPKDNGRTTRAGRVKFDKVPRQPRAPYYNASTANPSHTGEFAVARKALLNGSGAHGLGLVLTGLWMDAPDLIGIDVDGVLDPVTGEVYPDKEPVLDMLHALGTYTEVSPSGEGLRAFCYCDSLPPEFNNADAGVEVYHAGGKARFLTVTGDRYADFPTTLARVDPGVLDAALEPFQPRKSDSPAPGGASLPTTPPERPEGVPGLEALPIGPEFKAFLKDRNTVPDKYTGDRSSALYGATVAMLGAGMTPEAVYWALMDSDAFTLAEEHRGRDPEGYLWNTVRKAAAQVPGPAGPDEFNVLEDTPGESTARAKRNQPPPWKSLRIDDREMAEASLTPKCIVEGYLWADLANRVAPGGVGKTTLTLWESVHIALGRPLYGRTVATPGKVLIITAEDARARLVARLREIMDALFLSPAEQVKARSMIGIWDVSGHGAKLIEDRNGSLEPSNLPDAIVETYREDPPVLIEFDPLVSFGVAESRVNDNEQALVAAARRIIRSLDCCVRFTHHTGKGNARDGTTDQYTGRGGTALPDGTRMMQVLKDWQEGSKVAPPPTIIPSENAQVFQLHLPKLSYAGKKDKRTIWIRREGFRFDWAVEAPKTRADAAREDAAKLLHFIHAELAEGKYHTKTSLEKDRQRIPLIRGALRAATAFLLQHKHLEGRDIPEGKRQGGRTKYLHPLTDEIPPPNPAEGAGGVEPENTTAEQFW